MTDNLERQIWRCVDRELSAREQQALMSELDRLDGGWKRLSLALLEDRTVAEACRGNDVQPETVTLPLEVMLSRRSAQSRRASLATTAIVLLALVGTSFVLGRWTADGSGSEPQIADKAVRPPATGDGSEATAENDPGSVVAAEADDESPLELPQLLLELDLGAGRVESIPVSVLSADEWRQLPSASTAPLLSSSVRQSLRQSGYAVDERQELMLFPLEDGRHLSMPVETVLVRDSM